MRFLRNNVVSLEIVINYSTQIKNYSTFFTSVPKKFPGPHFYVIHRTRPSNTAQKYFHIILPSEFLAGIVLVAAAGEKCSLLSKKKKLLSLITTSPDAQ